MRTYIYKAKTNEGVFVGGAMVASQREFVISALKQKGYYLLSVEKEGRLSGILRRKVGISALVRIRQKAIFTQQLATLLKAGMLLVKALETLAKQCENKYLASVIEQIQTDVEGSNSLSAAMAKHPKVFSNVYTAIVRCAEEAGTLVETLELLAQQLKSQSTVHSRIKSALVYPIFLLIVCAAVVGVLVTFVVPKFIQLFVDTNQQLPLPTKILVGMTHFLQQSWWLALLVILGIVFALCLARRQEQIRLLIDNLLLRFPRIGILSQKLLIARFARTLGSLLNGGVSIVTAVSTTKATMANRAFVQKVAKIESEILKGSSIAKALSEQAYFSELFVNMTAVGEETGMLPEMLLEIADIYDQESESAINSITTLLGPFMIVTLGFIIGFVVLAILLPIFETTTIVH